jgi:hypothetical protein
VNDNRTEEEIKREIVTRPIPILSPLEQKILDRIAELETLEHEDIPDEPLYNVKTKLDELRKLLP